MPLQLNRYMQQNTEMRYSEKDIAAALLDGSGVKLLDAVLLALDLLRECGGRGNKLRRARKGIAMGADALRRLEKTVTFDKALQATIEAKSHRRSRTVRDIRYVMGTLMRSCPEIKRRHISAMTPEECQEYLDKAFTTTRQKFKARVIMNGIFTLSQKRGWCADNPIDRVDVPVVYERQIRALSIDEILQLRNVALADEESGLCAPAFGLMLYAGIRPREVERLRWKELDLKDGVLHIMPNHSKTGGMRHVTLYPVLRRWLAKFPTGNPDQKICPVLWPKRWKRMRALAGWGTEKGQRPWLQDCLRHTFASYHAKHFKSLDSLQMEMGHHSSLLLRTRYLNMSGISAKNAEEFWNME